MALSALFAFSVCANGVPSLRHDWVWPVHRLDFLQTFALATSGWNPIGMGQPNAYPDAYVLAIPLTLGGLLFGSLGCLAAFVFSIGVVCTSSVRVMLEAVGETGAPATFAVGAFALFNPWTYNEVVAGHLYMLLGFAALLGIVAQLLRIRPNPWALSLLAVLVYPQIQFFVLAVVALAIVGVRHRMWLPLLTCAIVAIPTEIGILGNLHPLLSTPFTLQWEVNQSVPVAKAFLLLGYFARYAAHYSGWLVLPLYGILGCVLYGAVLPARRNARRIAAALTVVLLVGAMGVNGPVSGIYRFMVTTVPLIGLYRELYDLIGLVAIGYAAFLSFGCRGSSAVRWVAAVCGAALIAIWFLNPPARWWVDERAIPEIAVQVQPAARYALIPAFQPMSYRGRGGGADPDAYYRPDAVAPLNQYFAPYPENKALAEYAASGDTADLAGLGVAAVYVRPWLRTNDASLSSQTAEAFVANKRAEKLGSVRISSPVPLVALSGLPRLGSLDNNLGAGNVFFGDAAGLSGVGIPKTWKDLPRASRIAVSNASLDAKRTWVDARFAFDVEPRLAQAFGGAFTTSTQPLSLASSNPLLVDVKGELLARNGKILLRSNGGYRWIALPRNTTAVKCRGKCVVALQAPSQNFALNPGARPVDAIEFQIPVPWLVFAQASSDTASTLRLNVRYNPNWIAISGGSVLKHFRVDAVTNGWILPPSPQPHRILILNVVALLQAAGELAGLCWIAALILFSIPRLRPRGLAS